MDTQSIVALMEFAMMVKETPRTGWNKKFPKGHRFHSRTVRNPESSGAHMFGLAFLAMLVADAFGADRLALIEMALAHDIVEFEKDRVTATEKGAKRKRLEVAKRKGEQKAIEAIARKGRVLGERIKVLWEEFEAGETREAKLLRQLDKLEMCFQAGRYHRTGQKLDPMEFFNTSKTDIYEPALQTLLADIERQCREP